MRNILAEFIFWLHLVIVAFWFVLLFVPMSWWEGKITFHFFLSIGIVGHQFLWGALLLPWSKKYGPVCILTTSMQWVRGFNTSDVRNYRHSWTKEFFERFGINPSAFIISAIPLAILLASAIQYFTSR